MGEGNAAAKGAKGRTSDGDRNRHLRDGATTRAKDQGRGKKRKEITKPGHTVEWIREWLTLITQLDGTGGHGELSKRA